MDFSVLVNALDLEMVGIALFAVLLAKASQEIIFLGVRLVLAFISR